VWLQERAEQVAKVLSDIVPQQPPAEHDVLLTLAKLCAKLHESKLPYGALLGWVFQTGHRVIIFEHMHENGRVQKYVMPELEPGESRRDQMGRICQEGADLQDTLPHSM
jgi:hypothetical protein